MSGRYYPDGVYDFKALVTGNYLFVDKTLMIRDVCDLRNKTLLFTRPRRFGKSINLSMMDYFFNVKYKDDANIFENLKIDRCGQCSEHRNAYPVVRMNFGDLKSDSVKDFRDSLALLVSDVCRSFMFLTGCNIDDMDSSFLKRCCEMTLSPLELEKSIRRLCSILGSYYGKSAIILVDEYDSCIQNIRSEDRFEEVVGALRPFMEQSFKYNENLHLGIITGIMPLAKTSMLSSFNNASVCSILERDGDEYFGFTEDEVLQLLMETENPSMKMTEIREWYDGYRFGDEDVFNPYSVMMYLKEGCVPSAYWNNMTGGGMSEDILSNMGAEPLSSLKWLYEADGRKIRTTINTRITYVDVLHPSIDPSAIYSYLAMTGYLKAVRTGKQINGLPECEVGIVNLEVSFAFRSLVDRATRVENRAITTMDSIYTRNGTVLKSQLESMLSGITMDHTWSQDEDPTAIHNRYRDLIMAYLVTPGSMARTEIPKGYGSTDIFFERTLTHPPVIIEVKTTVDTGRKLDSLADEALRQINVRCYSKDPDTMDAICVGIAIRQKTVEVKFG